MQGKRTIRLDQAKPKTARKQHGKCRVPHTSLGEHNTFEQDAR